MDSATEKNSQIPPFKMATSAKEIEQHGPLPTKEQTPNPKIL